MLVFEVAEIIACCELNYRWIADSKMKGVHPLDFKLIIKRPLAPEDLV